MNVLSLSKWVGSSTAGSGANGEHETLSTGAEDDAAWEAVRLWGLTNTGNTCYANSVLQALYFCDPFRLAVQAGRRPSVNATASSSATADGSGPAPLNLASAVEKAASSHNNGKTPVLDTKMGKQGGAPSPSQRPNGLTPHRRTASYSSNAGQLALGTPSGVPDGDAKQQASVSSPPQSGSSTRGVSPERLAVEDTLLSTLRDLFCAISFHPKRNGVAAPHAFINQLRKQNELFRSTMHQDAHEFLGYLLNEIAEELERGVPPPKTPLTGASDDHNVTNLAPRTWIHGMFEGILTNQTRCLTCETVTSRDESFLDLSIDIEDNSSVSACLRQFSANEMLAHKNKFSCDTCCGLQEAEKGMVIKKMPKLLALHLKRFKYQEDLQRFTKLAYRVAFPSELRLFNTLPTSEPNPDLLYSLWAVVVHIGVGPHAGHYITILRTHGRWLCFDDEVVTEVSHSELIKYFGDTPGAGSGYVLFYESIEVDRPDHTLAHVAHDLTPAQAALLGDKSFVHTEVEAIPGSPAGSTAAAVGDNASVHSPILTFAPVEMPSASKEPGLKGFFGLGRKNGPTLADDILPPPTIPLPSSDPSPTSVTSSPASRKASLPLNELARDGHAATHVMKDGHVVPPDSDAASTTSSQPSQPPSALPSTPTSGGVGKGLFGRGFLSKNKSMKRQTSQPGLPLDTEPASPVNFAASVSASPTQGSSQVEPPTSPKKDRRRGLLGSKN